ncbi:helix-turn-helix transcriptional regulator [Aeromonas hydrophila]|uniref:helix-turn-helix transcriptional regulator n=1 Tax=Aeromonas hydrophila TaxID=644 RepID=UPI0009C18F35|nr:AlpA family phage regulatory protein [Aeromonas hydrophila]
MNAVNDRVDVRILSMRDLTEKLGVGKSTIYSMIGEGRFPRGTRITAQKVGWLSSQVDEWIHSRFAA